MAETTTLARSNPFGNNYKIVAGNNPKAQVTTKNSSNPSGTVQLKKAWRITDDNDINKLRTMVNRQNINDRANYAYDVALNLARRDQEQDRRTRGFANFNTEADLTSKADKYYDQLMQGAEHPTGAQIRGENAFTQALGGIREGINGFNNMVGTGIDWGVDRFGDLVGAVTGRDDWKQSIQDATTGEDLAIIPDILEDIGLVALTGPVGGAALLGAKGLLQNTDNFQEALTGIDHITGERLTGGQRLANTAAGLGGTALTMLPGFSAAKAGRKLIGDEISRSFGEGVSKADEAIKAAEGGKKGLEEAADKAKKELEKALSTRDEVASQNAINAMNARKVEAAAKAPSNYRRAIEDIENIVVEPQKRLTKYNKAVDEARANLKSAKSAQSKNELNVATEKENKALAEQALANAQEAFTKFAPATGNEGAMTLQELAKFALRNPFSKEAREYNKLAKEAYKRNFANAYKADLEDVVDKDGKVTSKGSTRKAIWNIINGKTPGRAVGFDENIEAVKEGLEQAAKEEAKETVQKKGVKGILDRLNNKTIRQSTKGQAGGQAGFYGPGAIRGFGLTAGSGLAEIMANEPGGLQAAINNYADTMGQTPDSQLLPLALAMLPGYRKGFARVFAGDRLPYYGVKAQLAQRGVNNVYNNRYTDEDNENLLKAIGGK